MTITSIALYLLFILAFIIHNGEEIAMKPLAEKYRNTHKFFINLS